VQVADRTAEALLRQRPVRDVVPPPQRIELLRRLAQPLEGFGSAVVGSLYFGPRADHAFAWTVLLLAAVMVVVTPLTRLLRPRA